MPIATAYDDVPYPRLAFAFTHPSHLAVIGRLYGMRPAAVENCRVLELGCAAGSNLVPMAYALPRSTFVGIDLSARQIAEGREFVAGLGLKNIKLEPCDIREAAGKLGRDGPYDYIIAHGIYSWVPDAVKDALLATCRRLLAPQGIAYVSYNCYPGCQFREMLRRMCQFHGRRAADPREYAARSRRFLELLLKVLPESDDAYEACVRQQAAGLLDVSDEVLLHDDLEGDNDPLFFHEFMSAAAGHRLRYVGDAYFGQMFGLGIPDAALEKIRHAGDRLTFEQYLDFLYGRALRTTLLCHDTVSVRDDVDPDALHSLYVATEALPLSADGKPIPVGAVSMESHEPQTFRAPDCTLAVSEPLSKAAMLELCSAAPRPIPFATLRAGVGERLGVSADEANRRLSGQLIEWFATRMVELHAFSPPLTAAATARPLASAVARFQAARGWQVTNLLHRRVRLGGELAGRVLGLLNGRRDREAITEGLVAPVAAGEVEVRLAGQAITDPKIIRPVLAERVETCLEDFARHALLMESDA